MVNGIPVIGSNRGALPEVLGSDSCLPLDIDQWVSAINDLLSSEQSYEEACKRARARSLNFDSEVVKTKFYQLVERLRS